METAGSVEIAGDFTQLLGKRSADSAFPTVPTAPTTSFSRGVKKRKNAGLPDLPRGANYPDRGGAYIEWANESQAVLL